MVNSKHILIYYVFFNEIVESELLNIGFTCVLGCFSQKKSKNLMIFRLFSNLICGGDGIRTHDFLHAMQTL